MRFPDSILSRTHILMPKAKGIFQTAAKIYGNGGIKALYAGMSPKLLKGTIGNAIAFGSILTLKELNDSRLNTK